MLVCKTIFPVVTVPVDWLPEMALFSGIGSGEVILILVVMLLIFGPKQLPDLARNIGSALRGLKRATDEVKDEIGGFRELTDLESERPSRFAAAPPRTPQPEVIEAPETQAATGERKGEEAIPEAPAETESVPEQASAETGPLPETAPPEKEPVSETRPPAEPDGLSADPPKEPVPEDRQEETD